MVFKPNYNMQRAERNRAKQAKKDDKLREKEEAAARRKAEIDAGGAPSDSPAPENSASENASSSGADAGGQNGT